MRVAERAKAGAEESYTRALLDAGIEKCAKKLGEEALETALAAVGQSKKRVISEAADLLYHLLVVLAVADVPLGKVMAELKTRTGQSGIAEKAARQR